MWSRPLAHVGWCLTVFSIAACSNGGTGAADATSQGALLASEGALSPDRIPEEQREYFEDGQVTLAEYEEAYDAFTGCVADAGLGEDLREQSRDEVTGVITYSTRTLLLGPGQFDNTALNECYQRFFVQTEIAFQTTDAAVLAAEPQTQLDFFNENLRPCLESIGTQIPDDLAFNDANWTRLNNDAVRALEDGRCPTSVAGG